MQFPSWNIIIHKNGRLIKTRNWGFMIASCLKWAVAMLRRFIDSLMLGGQHRKGHYDFVNNSSALAK